MTDIEIRIEALNQAIKLYGLRSECTFAVERFLSDASKIEDYLLTGNNMYNNAKPAAASFS